MLCLNESYKNQIQSPDMQDTTINNQSLQDGLAIGLITPDKKQRIRIPNHRHPSKTD